MIHPPSIFSRASAPTQRKSANLPLARSRPREDPPLAVPRLVSPIPAPADAARASTRPRVAWTNTSGPALSVREFERCLVRERSLADRGTRRFCLIVLRRRVCESRAWQRLARSLGDHLRSTDIVGDLDGDRMGVLLADTEPEGAQIVADWIEALVAVFRIRIESNIYVYPSDESDSFGSGTMAPSSRSQGLAQLRPELEPCAPRNGSAEHTPAATAEAQNKARNDANAEGEGRVAPAVASRAESVGARRPVADLWTVLSVPTSPPKRALDVVVATLALAALAPLFLAVAIAIRLDSPGPVIFRQMRAGRGGRPFAFYKFRSMRADAEQLRAQLAERNEKDGPIFKIATDPRITRVGRFLRRWSIDELPQFWNILRGDLSLVGPRSPTLDEVARYERWQRKRLIVTGGLTCIWQVSGRSQLSFREWMRMDLHYVRRACLWFDLWLLMRTVPAVLSGRGAY